MELFAYLLILLVPIVGFAAGAWLLDPLYYGLSKLGDRVSLLWRKTVWRDRPVVGYRLAELIDGKLIMRANMMSRQELFGSNMLSATISREDVLQGASSLKQQFLVEILLHGELEQSDYDYRSRDYRVLQVVALKPPVRGIFGKTREIENLQPLLDGLQEKSGVIQPLRYLPSLEDFEPTVIEQSWRARRRAWKLQDYFATLASFYARDDLTVAPGLQPVDPSGVAISGKGQKRSKRRKAGSFEVLIAELQGRIAENSGRSLQKTLKLLLGELSELQGRLTEAEVSQEAKLLEVKYGSSLERLIELSSPDYYGSFFSKPERWSDPQRMALQVELSAVTLTKQLTEDLKGLNSPRELEFQLSVRSLVGRDSEPRSIAAEAGSVDELLQENAPKTVDLQGDLDSLREVLAAEEAALLEKQNKPKSLKQLLIG